jgi:hypothetical protein
MVGSGAHRPLADVPPIGTIVILASSELRATAPCPLPQRGPKRPCLYGTTQTGRPFFRVRCAQWEPLPSGYFGLTDGGHRATESVISVRVASALNAAAG